MKAITVDSSLFVGFHFLLISSVYVNHEIKCESNNEFPIGLLNRLPQNHKIKYQRTCKFSLLQNENN